MVFEIRRESPVTADLLGEMARLFQATVREVNARHYSESQIRVWSDISWERWKNRVARNEVITCRCEEELAGFIELGGEGYVDMLYVSARFQRVGVGRRLMEFLEQRARQLGARALVSNVSLTARPFFEAMGFRCLFAQMVTHQATGFQNFRMEKQLWERE